MRDTQEYFGNYLPEEGLHVQKRVFGSKANRTDDIEEVSQSHNSPIVQETTNTIQ